MIFPVPELNNNSSFQMSLTLEPRGLQPHSFSPLSPLKTCLKHRPAYLFFFSLSFLLLLQCNLLEVENKDTPTSIKTSCGNCHEGQISASNFNLTLLTSYNHFLCFHILSMLLLCIGESIF
ncbi:hypothetical protein O6H91_02G041700 [Diphasiastrum complanatum]|uniref:Uncharacterized protein n=1 Tax=Diphasiastrum complanatum TaxID=34168 RepID=A0ACC2EF33_DIPCM|nr:hypothetical protein O6H91_02G041700 [Diphasiastrum complanatum]